MVMAAKPTQMPVLAGAGEDGMTRRKSPPMGPTFLQPPFPEPWLGKRSSSIFGGSWTVVAILLTLQFCTAGHEDISLLILFLFLFVRIRKFFLRGLHHVVGARALDAVLIRIVINHRHLVAKVVVGRWRSGAPLKRCAFPRIIVRGHVTFEPAIDQVVNEDELGETGDERGNGDEPVNRDERDKVIVGESLIAANVARHSQVVERHEDAVGANEAEDEVGLA